MLACSAVIFVVAVPKLALAAGHKLSVMVIVCPLAVAVNPFVPVTLKLWLVKLTVPVPVVPAVFNVLLTAAVVILVMRPYASVVITGIAVADPVVTAPGPIEVRLTPVPLMVKLPAPELVLTTRAAPSYMPGA